MLSKNRLRSGLRCLGESDVRSIMDISYLMPCFRGDVAGALNAVLEDAPYGPNVEDAKVRSCTPW